jgi:hypothetical protein
MNIENLIADGLSGWIIFVISLILGGGAVVFSLRRRKTIQKNIRAGGDVAGGDIRLSKPNNNQIKNPNLDTRETIQTDITAGGDVAGGDIEKSKR